MTIEADIKTTLASLVSNRVYPDAAPFDPTTPFIVYAQEGGDPLFFFGREKPSKKNAIFQVRVWSTTRMQASSIARAAEDALITSSLDAMPMGALAADFDETMQWYGTVQNFSIWYDD